MNTPNSKNKPSKGWVLFCRLFVCGFGVFFLGYPIYYFSQQGHQLSAGLGTVAAGGLALIFLGIFTSAKTCEKIADWITCGFWV